MRKNEKLLSCEELNDWFIKRCNDRLHEIYGERIAKELEERVGMEFDVILQRRWTLLYYMIYKTITIVKLDCHQMQLRG